MRRRNDRRRHNRGGRNLDAGRRPATGESGNHGDAIYYTDLVERIRSGDRSAESELVQRFSRGLRVQLLRRLRDEQLANDFHQETFIVVLRKARQGAIREPEALKHFIRQVAVNLIIRDGRKDTRRKTDPDAITIEKAADNADSIPKLLERTQVAKLVRQSISELGVKRDQEIITRFHLNDEDKSSICEALELSTEHFDRVMYRARQRLKQLILENTPLAGPDG